MMPYFPNHVGFQVPNFVGQSDHSFPDQFYYPFESHQLSGTDLQQFTPIVEQVPSQTRRSKGRSALIKAPGGKKLKANAETNKQKADEIICSEKTENHDKKTTDYIHVRARRGQATDSHSLAERVRREKISERMQTLQALVPGCDKVNGKAFKLDQIITYIQSLQTQVQYLSMKLASVCPMYDDEMCQDQTKEHETNFKNQEITTKPTMAATATAFEEHQLESSNLLQRVQSIFSQDGSDEVLPWDVNDQTLTQNVINFDSYGLNNTSCNFY